MDLRRHALEDVKRTRLLVKDLNALLIFMALALLVTGLVFLLGWIEKRSVVVTITMSACIIIATRNILQRDLVSRLQSLEMTLNGAKNGS